MGKFSFHLNRFLFKRSYMCFVSANKCLAHSVGNPEFNSLEKIKFLRNRDYEPDKPKIANRICLTVLGNGSVGQPRCVCMFTDYKSYMFNCGEGVSRLIKEHQILSHSVRHVFITRKSWENLNGLADVYLTNQSLGVPKVTLHGPPGIEDYRDVVSAFDRHIKLPKKPHQNALYADDTMEVHYVPMYNKETNIHETQTNCRRNDLRMILEQDSAAEMIMSYICKIKPKPGELLLEKCVDQGVPIGPLLLELKNGEDVTLPCGKLVRSQDVCDISQPGSVFLVVDCPFESFIETFVEEEKFEQYHLPKDQAADVSAVFHFTPPHIVKSYKYQLWISKFHPSTLHFILNSANSTVCSEIVHQIQHMLHLLHPRIFSLLQEQSCSVQSDLSESSRNVIQADALQQLHIRPHQKFERCNVVNLDPERYIRKAKGMPGFWDSLEKLHQKIDEKQCNIAKGVDYPEVLFLGTGSSSPGVYRNVSGILVNVDPERSILLDCGEGTYSQLVRYFGYQNIDSVLRKICCIFISHHHTDHYLGLFKIIKSRKEAFCSFGKYVPLAVSTSFPLDSFVDSYHKKFESLKSDVRFFSNRSLTSSSGKAAITLKSFLGKINLCTVRVQHCYDSYGVVLSSGTKWKIVFSGDSAPCQSLIDAGKDCTLLIHEATIDSDHVTEANLKKHSTPAQVIEVAEMMNAKYTILTHFSGRFLSLPAFPDTTQRPFGFAFDYMRVQMSDLPLLPLFIPVLKCLLSDIVESHLQKHTELVKGENLFLRSLET